MILYHGTTESFKKKAILKNGFILSDDNNLLESGIYCTPYYSLAYDFTSPEYPPYRKNKRRVITFEVNDKEILHINYQDIAKLCGLNAKQDEWQYSVDRLLGVKRIVLDKRYKGIEVVYTDISEVCIYDSSIIYNLR